MLLQVGTVCISIFQNPVIQTGEEMIMAGVRTVSRNNNNVYDTFRERVIFPIIDLRGNVIAFGGKDTG